MGMKGCGMMERTDTETVVKTALDNLLKTVDNFNVLHELAIRPTVIDTTKLYNSRQDHKVAIALHETALAKEETR